MICSPPRRDRRRSAPRVALCAAALLCAVGAFSCAAPPIIVATAGLTAAQTGTGAYVRGVLQGARLVDLERAIKATDAAIENMGYEVLGRRIDDDDARYDLRQEQGSRIRIRLERRAENVVKFHVRVGVFGDQAISRLVQSRIDAHLPEVPPVRLPGWDEN